MMIKQLGNFINEREHVRIGHDAGNQPPWTKDPILQKYRFCNVRREDDAVTAWLSENWRDEYAKHVNLTVAMVLARLINWPPTLRKIGFPGWWDSEYIGESIKKMHKRADAGKKVWSSAYVVTTCGKKMDKAAYVFNNVCADVVKKDIHPEKGDTLESFWNRLRQVDGLGAGFLAAQVVADLKNTPGNHLAKAEDWWTWATPGPGSRRGVNRFYEWSVGRKLTDDAWLMKMLQIKRVTGAMLPKRLLTTMCMQDWQNCMCEFDKYERVRHGEGRPKQNYRPTTEY
jgi:hypothetical protein